VTAPAFYPYDEAIHKKGRTRMALPDLRIVAVILLGACLLMVVFSQGRQPRLSPFSSVPPDQPLVDFSPAELAHTALVFPMRR
jgi:hypothetical protein